MPPGRTSKRLMRARRIARPIVAVARSLLPSALKVALAPISCRIGPFIMTRTAQPPVLEEVPCRRNSSFIMACQAVATTGKCIGRQPAITELMASFSAVMGCIRTGSMPSSWSGGIPAQSKQALTEASVGGTTGSPSVHPLL